MPILTFSETKRPILTFDALDMSSMPDGGEFLVTAEGAITFQDTPAVEELMHGKDSCLLHISENEQVLLDGRFKVTFLVLEPDQLVIRISAE